MRAKSLWICPRVAGEALLDLLAAGESLLDGLPDNCG